MKPRYATKDHLPKCLLEAATHAGEVLAASPYVSDDRLFRKVKRQSAHLYTDFSIMNFALRSSSLRVIKKLMNNGVSVYHVENLHAKVVLIDDKHFSIGSQNLTLRGRRTNHEASFVSGSKCPSKDVRAFFAKIAAIANPVTSEEVDEMEIAIKPFLKEVANLKSRLQSVAVEFDRNQLQRVGEQKRETAEAKQPAEVLAKPTGTPMPDFEPWISLIPDFGEVAGREKRGKRNSLIASIRLGKSNALVPTNHDSTFSELLTNIGVKYSAQSRYLVVNAETGRLGLVRCNKTQWTFFESGMLPGKKLQYKGLEWKADIRFEWTERCTRTLNGKVTLVPEGTAETLFERLVPSLSASFVCTPMGFGLRQVTLVNWNHEVSPPQQANISLEFADLLIVREYLIQCLTNPFKFKEKSRLAGVNAAQFLCAPPSTRFSVEAHPIGKTAIFSVREIPKSYPAKDGQTLLF